jgi:hypothetical protein
MPDLYLHIGHSKTGTTWLQAVLALSQSALASQGLAYPSADTRDPESTEIILGNAPRLGFEPDLLGAELAAALRDAQSAVANLRGVVFSSEELFPNLIKLPDPGRLQSAATEAGFERIHIILFIRDPIGHAVSLWQQYLKRGGGTASLKMFLEKYAVPERVAGFLKAFGPLQNVSLTVRNYSTRKAQLGHALAEWLNVPDADLRHPDTPPLNRSLTRAELVVQIAVNRHLGRAGCLLSDALCQDLAALSPDDMTPDYIAQDALWNRLASTLAQVNATLAPEDRYRDDRRAPADTSAIPALSEAQLTLIGGVLGAEIRRLRLKLAQKPIPNTVRQPDTQQSLVK